MATEKILIAKNKDNGKKKMLSIRIIITLNVSEKNILTVFKTV